MAEIIVGKAGHEDRERLAEAFADAFVEDPIFGWLLEGKPHRDRRLMRFFRILLRDEVRQSDHEVYLSEDGSGGAIWKGIDRWKTPLSFLLRQTPGMALAFGPANARPWKILGVMEKVHPREPHYYLETLGTKRAVQGKGVGSAVMSLMLDRCDREGVPAYLESSNPRNIPFYARHGFEVRDPVPLPPGAPVLTPMWREPLALDRQEVDVRVEAVPAALTFPLRQRVLRAHEPLEELALPGDDDPETCHVAAMTATGQVVGTANVRREGPPWEPGAEGAWRLRGMATTEELRGHGIGARLLDALLAHIASRDGGLVWCNARVAALRFYQRAGFVTHGEPWVDPDLGPHLTMWRQVSAR